MNPKTFCHAVGALFLVLAAVHLARIIAGWEIVVHGGIVPVWASAIAVIVLGYIGWTGLRIGR